MPPLSLAWIQNAGLDVICTAVSTPRSHRTSRFKNMKREKRRIPGFSISWRVELYIGDPCAREPARPSTHQRWRRHGAQWAKRNGERQRQRPAPDVPPHPGWGGGGGGQPAPESPRCRMRASPRGPPPRAAETEGWGEARSAHGGQPRSRRSHGSYKSVVVGLTLLTVLCSVSETFF